MAESKVTGIIKALNGLESNLDSLNSKVADMKKQLSVQSQNEIDSLMERAREIATKEAETIINAAKEKATAESLKISQEGKSKINNLKSNIDANFDQAVRYVVSTVLKA